MKRVFNATEPELMDRPQPVSNELGACLRNLARLNRYFGSHFLIRKFLRQWLQPAGAYRILDLATGYADIPRMIVSWARARGITVSVEAVDSHPSTLEIARQRSAEYAEISFTLADARSFTASRSFDMVCCSLALHHFSEEDAVKLLARMRDLSHDKILVADLERNELNLACVYAVTSWPFCDPMTRADGRVSVKRSFSYREMEQLATMAGWDDFCHARFPPARQAIWMGARDEVTPLDLVLPEAEFAPG